MENDNKVKAMTDLLGELKYASYPVQTMYKVLNVMEKKGIPYLLDELPEGKSLQFYSEKLDEYLVKILKQK
jgi:hypothetical protein